MAYLFGDGFDCYSAIADMDDGYWDSISNTNNFSIVATGRFSGSQALGSTAGNMIKNSGNNDERHHLSVAIQQTSAITGSTTGFFFTFGDGATDQCTVFFRSDGAIVFTRGNTAGTVLATYTGALTASNTWYQFEIEVNVSNTAGYMFVRKLGNTSNDFATATNLDTSSNTNNYANRLTIGGGASEQIDDLLWRSDSAANGVPWTGDLRCFTRRPASDASVQWSPSAAAVPLTPFTQNTSTNAVLGTARYGPFTPTVSGTVGTVVLTTNAGNTGNTKCTIFSDAAGKPGTILGSANIMTNTATGPVTFTFPSPVSVTAGTQYWVGWCSDTAVTNYFSVAAGTAGASFATTYAAFPTANPGSVSNSPEVMTVYTTPTGGSGTNYGFVSEPQQDAATSYVYSSTVGQSDLYGISSISSTPASIVAVTTRAYMQKSDAGTRNVAVQLKSGSTTVSSASAALNTVFNWQYRTDVVDPATGAPWTAVGVNNCNIGVIVQA